MIIQVPAGVYVVAVSGGVDSVALLDMLAHQDDIECVVAHVDHGIRKESSDDAAFVEQVSKQYGMTFECLEAQLGSDASEDEARKVRYAFLRQVQKAHHADAIITAHHQDDVIETAMLNILRGTGRRGLTSLDSTAGLLRPLLSARKAELIKYAGERNLSWVEDATNNESAYARNNLRNGVLATASDEWKGQFVEKIDVLRLINARLDQEVSALLSYRLRDDKAVLSRSWFVKLDHELACECMYAMLRRLKIADIDSAMVERLTIALKVAAAGAKFDINKSAYALITKRSMRFMSREGNKTLRV